MSAVLPGWMRPAPWLAAVPLLCAALALLWGCGSDSGVRMPGRGAGALLVAGCLLSLLPGRLGWSWRSPLPWLMASLAWQGIALLGWTAAREPGLQWWGERAGALLTALGIAAWCREQPPLALVRATVAAGAGVLVLAVVGQLPGSTAWPCGPDLPFGNPNFMVGGALPLLGLALPFWRDRLVQVAGLCGLVAALVLGSGLRCDGHGFYFGDAARAAWLGLGALLGMAVVLRLPRRSHAWVVGLGEVAVLTLLALLIAGVVPLPVHGASNGYRLALWNCALEAIAQAPLVGSGPASAVVVLQDQVSFAAAWLWVPSFAEHAHNEYLNALVEGGALGALLLAAALLATLAPLWRRRDEPLVAGLLIAWAGVLTQALVESHLSQPGPLVLLALLTGVTWACTQPLVVPAPGADPIRLRPLAAIAIGALLFAQQAREFNDGGSAQMIVVRAERRMDALHDDWAARAEVAAGVRDRLGDLDRWPSFEAVARIRAGDYPAGEDLVAHQLARLPVDTEMFDLALRLRDRHAARGERLEAARVQGVLIDARDRGMKLLAVVPDSDRTHALRADFVRLAKRVDP